MKLWLILLFTVLGLVQDTDPKTEWEAYWHKLNEEFADPEESPLTEEDRASFSALKTFDYNPNMRVIAKFTPIDDSKVFGMKTSTERKPLYRKVGKLRFTVAGVEEKLSVYQNIELSKAAEYKNYLFIPFTDLTNFEESYGGGRYLDVEGPIGETLVVDFNKAYNPYCAYNDRYSCPIPPIENHLELRITAGVLVFHDHNDH